MTLAQQIAAAVSAMAAERDAAWCAHHGVTSEAAMAQRAALREAADMIQYRFGSGAEKREVTSGADSVSIVVDPTPKPKAVRPRKAG